MTTKADILLIAPELSDMTTDQFNLAIADSSVLVSMASCSSKTNIAQRYLAAHLLTIARPDSGGLSPSGASVTGEKAGRESRTYGTASSSIDAGDYSLTKYGIMYMSVIKSCVDTLTVMVV